jgi:hypothetical protein
MNQLHVFFYSDGTEYPTKFPFENKSEWILFKSLLENNGLIKQKTKKGKGKEIVDIKEEGQLIRYNSKEQKKERES